MQKILRGVLRVMLSALLMSEALAEPASKPNVLFLLTEDQGAQLGAFGTAGLQTPHMDALAKSGMVFRHAFVSYPVCSPSKACLYTSLHSHTTGLLNNTVNYHKPSGKLTEQERSNPLYLRNRIRDAIPTLVERLRVSGYYQGVTHKLHVAPVEKFPYDEFLAHSNGLEMKGFIERAKSTGKPWHLFYNIATSHRPFPDSDRVKIRVRPEDVKLPAFLPDTPVVRKDWSEYLAAIELADRSVGEALEVLRISGQEGNTIVVFLGDHGPAFQHGKMTLYDLGLRVPLVIRTPDMKRGSLSEELVSELDLMPTLLDLLNLPPLEHSHGLSLLPLIEGRAEAKGHDYVFAEISHRGSMPNDGMQERSVCDGRWHLIYREKFTPAWRQVQADSIDWKLWRNRTYDETIRVKTDYPELFRILAEMNPQKLGGKLSALELYDLQSDPWEMHNLSRSADARLHRDRLFSALKQWVMETSDASLNLPASLPE